MSNIAIKDKGGFTDSVVSEELYNKLSSHQGFKSETLGRHYTPEEKIQVAAYWLGGYSSRDLEPIVGIPAATIRYWMQTKWWKQLLSELRRGKNEELDNRLTRIIHKSVAQLEDRLDKGNSKYNPSTGEYELVPLSSSELAKDALGVTFDKRALTRGDPTSRIHKEELQTSDKLLEQLAQQFVKIVKQSEPKVIEATKVADGTYSVPSGEREVIKEDVN